MFVSPVLCKRSEILPHYQINNPPIIIFIIKPAEIPGSMGILQAFPAGIVIVIYPLFIGFDNWPEADGV